MRTATLVFALALFATMGMLAQAPPHPSVTLNWTWSQGSGDAATGFHLQRSATTGGPYTVVGTVPLGTSAYLDTTVAVGATYYYIVTAYNPAGDSAPSPEVSCTLPFLKPGTPTALSGTVH